MEQEKKKIDWTPKVPFKPRPDFNAATFARRNKRLKLSGFKTYAEFLASDKWKDLRAKAKARGGFWASCFVCGSGSGIQLHHNRYRRFAFSNPRLTDVFPACGPCHQKIHDISREQNVSFRVAARKLRKLLNRPAGLPQ